MKSDTPGQVEIISTKLTGPSVFAQAEKKETFSSILF